jgi:catechol 2,3-dioxygenase-like lactoylglutathione lyase family enzyme
MISGIHHVKLPVTDVGRSRDWYVKVLGFESTIEFVENGELMGVAMHRNDCPSQIALRQDFVRARALSGFDAVALQVPAAAEVHNWATALDRLGEAHGGVVTGHGGGTVLVGLHDPDGIEIRLYAEQAGPR